jgi:hypothetical protein
MVFGKLGRLDGDVGRGDDRFVGGGRIRSAALICVAAGI